MDVPVNARLPAGMVRQIDQVADRLNEHPARQAGIAKKANRSSALRAVAETGLAAIERRRAWLADGETRARVEPTPEEEAAREQQRRFAEAAMREREARQRAAEALAVQVVGWIRGGVDNYQGLLFRMRPPRVGPLQDAIRLLQDRGRLSVVSAAAGKGSLRRRVFVLDDDPSAPAPAPPLPSVARVMGEIMEIARVEREVRSRELPAATGASGTAVSEALGILLARRRLTRLRRGTFQIAAEGAAGRATEGAGNIEAVVQTAIDGLP